MRITDLLAVVTHRQETLHVVVMEIPTRSHMPRDRWTICYAGFTLGAEPTLMTWLSSLILYRNIQNAYAPSLLRSLVP